MKFYIEKNSGFSEADLDFLNQYGSVSDVGTGVFVDIPSINNLAEIGRRYGQVVITSWPDRAHTDGAVMLILERNEKGDLVA